MAFFWVHPNQEMVGVDYFHRDFDGVYAVRKFIEIAKSRLVPAFIEYNYPFALDGRHVRAV